MSRPSAEYRQDAHVTSLSVWTLLCAAAATVLFVHSGKLWNRPLAGAEIAGGIALLIFGPAGLAIYVLRARRVWVSVDAEQGVTVSGTRVISWDQIERIERRRPRLRSTTGPATAPSLQSMAGPELVPDPKEGCLFGEFGLLIFGAGLLVMAVAVVYWLVFPVFISLILIPVLEVFAPLGDRVRVVVRGGRPLVLRDLRNADGFLAEVRPRVPVVEA